MISDREFYVLHHEIFLNKGEKEDCIVRLLIPFIHAQTFQWINRLEAQENCFI